MKQQLSLLLFAALLLSTQFVAAQTIKVISPPDPNAVVLLVLEAKQEQFLPHGTTVEIVAAPAGGPQAMKKIITEKQVDIGLFNFMSGGEFYSQGITNLRLAGVHVWGGIAILSKNTIAANDWAAMATTTAAAIAIPALDTPAHRFALQAATQRNIDISTMTTMGLSPAAAIKKITQPHNGVDFIFLPEPWLSIFLQQQQNGEQHYHLFADTAKALSPKGVPLGALWIIDGENCEQYDDFIYAFEQAIDYIYNPVHAAEVANILQRGFKQHFAIDVPETTFSAMINRQILKLNFREATQVAPLLTKLWHKNNFATDPHIFYQR
ncbi:MAG: hypothetical protein JRG71_16790, partial [Deltaproteobacteria bacterium]|nr:hypothetical protein [Deltaproteobacteria bacterium]